jgi:hypothetical protein
MIVEKIQSLVDYVRGEIRTRVYKTLQDPDTSKEYVNCEIYTKKGFVEKLPEKGNNIDNNV